MRARNIKPGFFSNEQLVQCSDGARLLFAGLWCMADCDGLLEDRPLKIKAHVFPIENRDVEPMIAELARAGLILRYQRDGKSCICVPNFRKHQRPHPKEVTSGLPKPSRIQQHLDPEETHLNTAETNLKTTSCSSSLNPEFLNPSSLNPELPAEEESESKTEAPPPRSIADDRSAFERFWKAYPHKTDKLKTETAWNRLLMEPGFDTEAVIKAIELQSAAGVLAPRPGSEHLRGFNWLYGHKWNDEIDPKKLPKPPTGPKAEEARIIAERARREAERAARIAEIKPKLSQPKGPDP